MPKLRTRPGFILLETVVTLGLLFSGLLSFEGVEITMQRQERRMLDRIQIARQRYEQRHPVNAEPLPQGADHA